MIKNIKTEKKIVIFVILAKKIPTYFFTNLTGQHVSNFKKLFLAENEIFFEVNKMLSGKVCKKNKLVSFLPK